MWFSQLELLWHLLGLPGQVHGFSCFYICGECQPVFRVLDMDPWSTAAQTFYNLCLCLSVSVSLVVSDSWHLNETGYTARQMHQKKVEDRLNSIEHAVSHCIFCWFPEEELIISSCKTNIFGGKKYDSRFLCNVFRYVCWKPWLGFFSFSECFSSYLFCHLPDYGRKQEVQVDFCGWTIVVRADKLWWFWWFVNSALWVLCKVGGACYWLRAVFWRVQCRWQQCIIWKRNMWRHWQAASV